MESMTEILDLTLLNGILFGWGRMDVNGMKFLEATQGSINHLFR